MKIGFIGSGKVGSTLGKYFVTKGRQVSGYYSKTQKSAKQTAEFTGTRYYDSLNALISASDTIFVTTPDDMIKGVWEQIKQLSIENKLICHCSGSLSSAVFSQIDTQGAFGYSVHPLQSISSREQSYQTLSQCLFTLEGNPKRIDIIKEFFESLGNTVQVISAENKIKYHAAAVTVSNHMLSLFRSGINMLMSCGFTEKPAQAALLPLAIGNLEHLKTQSITEALTGPVERCDEKTIKHHIYALEESEKQLYLLLAAKLLPMAKEKNPNRDYSNLETLIYGGSNQ